MPEQLSHYQQLLLPFNMTTLTTKWVKYLNHPTYLLKVALSLFSYLKRLTINEVEYQLDEIDEDSELGGSHIRPDDADSSPFWQLYDAVHNYVDNQGILLLI